MEKIQQIADFLKKRQKSPIKFHDGDSGNTIGFYHVDDYPTEDTFDLLRFEGEGGPSRE